LKKIFNTDNIGFGGLQWFFWSGFCTLFAFLVLYLKSRNYNAVQIGVIMSAISVVSIFGQPFWGHYSDRKHTMRNVLVVCLAVSGVVSLLIPVFSSSYIIVIMICLLISFTENSMPTIIDSWIVNSAVKRPWIDYGLTRGLGSLGYAITAVVFGVMLDKFGYGLIFPVHFVLIVITIGFCFFIEKTHRAEVSYVSAPPKLIVPKLNLLESKDYIIFLIASTLVFTGFRATATFYPLLLSMKGGNNSDMGLSLSIMALSEVPVLFLSRKLLLRFKDTFLIAVSMLFFIVRVLLHIVVPTVPGLIAIQAIQSLSFALFLPAAVYYIKRISPDGLNSTYQTIAASCYFGIGGIAGGLLGGIIIDKAGIYNMLWLSCAVTLLGMLIFIFSNRQSQSANNM
jgi:PPP family 3-phenylpropionic acid transporter